MTTFLEEYATSDEIRTAILGWCSKAPPADQRDVWLSPTPEAQAWVIVTAWGLAAPGTDTLYWCGDKLDRPTAEQLVKMSIAAEIAPF